jgi:hypothetical protein
MAGAVFTELITPTVDIAAQVTAAVVETAAEVVETAAEVVISNE